MLEKFSKQYSLSKTISIGLIPEGNTVENVKSVIESDQKRDANAKIVKSLIDRYHRHFISTVLSCRHIIYRVNLQEYYAAYLSGDSEGMAKCADRIADDIATEFKQPTLSIKGKRQQTIEVLSKHPDTTILDVMVNCDLYTDDEKAILQSFKGFTTYFTKFFNTRSLLYSFETSNGAGLSGSVIGRILNDNLPRFLYNLDVYKKVSERMDIQDTDGYFSVDGFNLVLGQEGVDAYNTILGGVADEAGTKTLGLNERINLYNQQIDKSTGEKPLPLFKMLYKLPLVERESASFVISAFDSEADVITSVKSVSTTFTQIVMDNMETSVFEPTYDFDEVYVGVENISEVSKILTEDWRTLENAWNASYDKTKSVKVRNKDGYSDKRRKEFKKVGRFSITDICELLETTPVVVMGLLKIYFAQELKVKALASVPYRVLERDSSKKFTDDEKLQIKNYLDSIKDCERFFGLFCSDAGDPLFVSNLTRAVELFDGYNTIYNKVRNFCTKKPYDDKKFKLSMNNCDFLTGWAVSNEPRRRGFILRDKGAYYLAVSLTSKVAALQTPTDDDDYYEKMVYMQIPDAGKALPKMFFADNYVREHGVSQDLVDLINKRRAGGTYTPAEEQSLIRYYIDCIRNREEWDPYEFNFKPMYGSLREFISDVNNQSYNLRFIHISKAAVKDMMDSGDLLLFRFYNRNFSEYSHGRDGAYTRYFKLLFADENRRGEFLQLKGGAELFFRPKSLERNVTHPKNQPIKNKNPRTNKQYSKFNYDLIKDRRFTEDKFMLNLCIGINSMCEDNRPYAINQAVREHLKNAEKYNVIGINRGENNLIYLTVIDRFGRILESKSLNVIDNYDYNAAMTERGNQRTDERVSWGSISDIKNLKSGYIGKAVHEICKMIVKYDAIVVFDNVNGPFVSSRGKIEKNVYQKLQQALVQKLNYLTFKDTPENELGSFKYGYQLSNPYKNPNDLSTQNGIIFFLSPWGISRVDPKTGFMDLLHAKYVNMDMYKEFLAKFTSISYVERPGMFKFKFDYKNFLDWQKLPGKTDWTIYSNGERTEFYMDKRSGRYKMNVVDLTAAFKDLFDSYGVAYGTTSHLLTDILKINKPDFFKQFNRLLSLTLQMVNHGEDDAYVLSPVLGADGKFFDSRNCESYEPSCSDANASYNMARKGLMLIDNIKRSEDGKGIFTISKQDFLNYVAFG